ncbi:MAG: NAD(P)H-dependent oxidoreductase subunit E [Miltoncostaeaceae bacterium]
MTAHEISEFLAPIRHEFPDQRSLILPALRFAQEEQGWLPPESMAAVAEATGYSQAYVESVASFYDRLYTEPVGRRVISVCTTLSCMLRGSDELLAHVAANIGTDGEGTSADGMFTLQRAECLGACDRAPCLQVDSDDQQGPLTHDDADAIIGALRADGAPTRYDR